MASVQALAKVGRRRRSLYAAEGVMPAALALRVTLAVSARLCRKRFRRASVQPGFLVRDFRRADFGAAFFFAVTI